VSLRRLLDTEAVRGAAWTAACFVLILLAFQVTLPRDVPLGVLGLGLTLGCLNALLAVGLILIYRSNRIINFAQAQLGAVSATLCVQLVSGPGVPYLLALAAALVFAVVLGALVEVLVIRRFADAPRLILTVATIGLAQVLAFLEYLVSTSIPTTQGVDQYRTAFSGWSFTIEPVRFTGDFLVAVLVLPIAVGGVWVFLTRTSLGTAVRASAESSERAAQLGVPVRRVSTTVWVVAALLAALTATLRAPIVGISVGTALGPALLLRALAPAVVGRMQSIPTAVVAALLLGVLEQGVFYGTGNAALVDVLLLGVIVAALLRQKVDTGRATRSSQAAIRLAAELRPVPPELRRRPEVLAAQALGIVLAAVGLGLAVTVTSQATSNLMAIVPIYAIICLSLVVLTGWCGQISLGQFALVGVGAAVAGKLSSDGGWDFLAALVAGSLAAVAVALVLGLVSLRIQGFFLAVTTLAFAVAASSWFLDVNHAPWLVPSGTVDRPLLLSRYDLEDEHAYLLFCVAVLLLTIAATTGVRRSRTGRAIIALRDNDRAVQSYGVSALQTRLVAFGFSGALAGLAGGLLVHHQHGLSVTAYAPTASLSVFSIAVIGGLGSVTGAVLGAVYFVGVQYFAPTPLRVLAIGFGQLFLLLAMPGGLGTVVATARDAALRALARRRGIRVPSLLRDDLVDAPPSPPEPPPVTARPTELVGSSS
jgi:branched-chain amino acid transport system permease protein